MCCRRDWLGNGRGLNLSALKLKTMFKFRQNAEIFAKGSRSLKSHLLIAGLNPTQTVSAWAD